MLPYRSAVIAETTAGLYLRGGRILHRSLGAGGARPRHARAQRPRAARLAPPTSAPRPANPCCGGGSPAPRSRRCLTGDAGDRRHAVSFHPAGHILGSAQIRVEHRGEVWVVSGDYKRARSDLRAVRAGALPHVHHRSHLRAADLHLGRAGHGGRRDPRVVAREPRRRAAVGALLLRARQGAADPRRAARSTPTGRSHLHGAMAR